MVIVTKGKGLTMTHYNIDYSSIKDDSNKREKAIKDIIDYVGREKFDELNKLLIAYVKEKNPSLDDFSMALFMFPVSGYPIQAWYETIQHSLKG